MDGYVHNQRSADPGNSGVYFDALDEAEQWLEIFLKSPLRRRATEIAQRTPPAMSKAELPLTDDMQYVDDKEMPDKEPAITALARVVRGGVNAYCNGDPDRNARVYATRVVDIATDLLDLADPRTAMQMLQELYDKLAAKTPV